MDNTAKLWDLKGNELQSFRGHWAWVFAVAFSPNGEAIVTGSADGTAKLWLTPQVFLEQNVQKIILQELYDAGAQLEPEGLKKVKQNKNERVEMR